MRLAKAVSVWILLAQTAVSAQDVLFPPITSRPSAYN